MTMTLVDPPADPIQMPWEVFPELHSGDCHVYQWAIETFIEDVAAAEYLASHLEHELDRTIVKEGYDVADYGDKQWAMLRAEHFKPDLFGRKFTDELPHGVVLAAVAIRTRNFAVVGRA